MRKARFLGESWEIEIMAAPKRGNYYNIWEKYGCRTGTVMDFDDWSEGARATTKKVCRTKLTARQTFLNNHA